MLPSASGAAIERADRISAAFHGAIAATTPTGRRMPIANVPGLSDGMHLADRRVRERGRLAEAARARSASGTSPKPKVQPVSRASSDDDLVAGGLEDVGRLQEDPLPHRRRRLRPRREGRRRRLDRAPRVLAAACGHARDDLAGERDPGRRTSRRWRRRPTRRRSS